MKILTRMFAGAAAVAFVPALVVAQSGKLTDVTVEGHIYEPQKLAPTDARLSHLTVPSGLKLQRFAEGLDNPRILAVADDGTIYVSQRTPGNVVMLRDTDGDGVVDLQKIVLKLKDAHGLAIRGRQLYVTDVKRVYAAPLGDDGTVGKLRTLVKNLPDGGQHPNRTLGFSPDGELFVTVGSTCNECREPNPENATVLRVTDPQGSPRRNVGREIFASGLRNTIGFGWHPGSGRLIGFDQGIDWLGDNEQSEEVNALEHGKRYGWPYVYDEDQINPHNEPVKLTSEQWARISEEPVGMYTAHSASMQLAFYDSDVLGANLRGSAFIAMRGSWNRKPPSGYELVRTTFTDSGELESVEPFVGTFLERQRDGNFGYFARPVGVAIGKDGAVLLGDDTNNTIYRISREAAAGTPPPQRLATDIFAVPQTIELSSPAFADGQPIDLRYSDYGPGVSPPLHWKKIPQGTRSLVMLMEDPDALAPLPFVHWLAVNVPAGINGAPEGVRTAFAPYRDQPVRQGSNSKSTTGYFGPRPPAGDPPHRYHFQLFALDTELALPDGFNRAAVLKAMSGHVLAKGVLTGTYQQPE